MGPEILSWSSAFRRDQECIHSLKVGSSMHFYMDLKFGQEYLSFIHMAKLGSKDKNCFINFYSHFFF